MKGVPVGKEFGLPLKPSWNARNETNQRITPSQIKYFISSTKADSDSVFSHVSARFTSLLRGVGLVQQVGDVAYLDGLAGAAGA